MKLRHIHHIAIIASDYEKTKDFYVRKLGYQVVREVYREDRADYKLDLKMGRQQLEIFVVRDAPKRLSYPEACGLRHLAFEVVDLDAAMKELNEKGIETEEIRFDPFSQVRMSVFKDPDGLPIEIREIEE